MSQAFEFEKNGVAIDSLTLTAADFDANGLWSSDAKSVGNFAACQAFTKYEQIDPDFQTPTGNQLVDYDMFARLEAEFSPGIWHSICSQIEPFDSDFADAKTRVLVADPAAFVPNPDSEEFDGFDTSVVRKPAHIGNAVRLCLFKKDLANGGLPFSSVTISMDGLLY